MRRKYYMLLIFPMVLLTACACAASPKTEEQRQVSETPNFVGAYQEMNTPEFWISGIEKPDEILMTASQIEKFNQNVPNTDKTDCVDLDGYKRSLGKAELLEHLQKYVIPEETRYIGETPLESEYYETLLRNRNEESVGEQNAVRLGVIVMNTELRT